MHLSSENILSIQQFLCDGGFIQEAPSEIWTPHKLSGYRTYLESKNLLHCSDPEPSHIGSLPIELQTYLNIPNNVKSSDESSEEDDLDLDDDLLEDDLTKSGNTSSEDLNENKDDSAAGDNGSQEPQEPTSNVTFSKVLGEEESTENFEDSINAELKAASEAAAQSSNQEPTQETKPDENVSTVQIDTKKLNKKPK